MNPIAEAIRQFHDQHYVGYCWTILTIVFYIPATALALIAFKRRTK